MWEFFFGLVSGVIITALGMAAGYGLGTKRTREDDKK